MKSLTLDDFALFEELSRSPSMSAVARARNVPVSVISRALGRIEAACGTRLVRRSTHALSLTDEGEAFLEHARRIAQEQHALADRLGDASPSPRGTVRISVSQLLATYVLMDALPSWRHEHPALHVDLQLDDRMIDMAGERVDIAVRAGTPPAQTQIVRPLGEHRRALFAAPDYLRRNGNPATPADLAGHALIANSAVHSHNQWAIVSPGGERSAPSLEAAFRVNSSAAVVAMAVAGVGIARINSVVGERLCAQGSLVPVLDKYMPPDTFPIYAVVLSERQRALRILATLDLLQRAFSAFRLSHA